MKRNRVLLALFAVAMFFTCNWGDAANAGLDMKPDQMAAALGQRGEEGLLPGAAAVGKRPEPWAGGTWLSVALTHFGRGELSKAKQLLLARRKMPIDWADYTLVDSYLKEIHLGQKGAFRADCGASALSRLLASRGQAAEPAELDKDLRRGEETASLADVVRVASRYGVTGQGAVLDASHLREIRGAWIAYLDSGHMVLVSSADEQKLVVIGSDGRSIHYTAEAFAEKWSGTAVVFDKVFLAKHPEALIEDTVMAFLVGGDDEGPPPVAPPGTGGDSNGCEDGPGSNCYNCADVGGGGGGGGGGGPGPTATNAPCCSGSPVWSVSLNRLSLIVRDRDIWYSSSVGPSVEIVRCYNSDNPYTGAFGRKWAWNYGSSVAAGQGSNVILTNVTGRQIDFVWTGTAYLPRDGSQDILVRNSDGTFVYYCRNNRLTYRYQSISNGGKLTSISDRNGNSLTLNWSANRVQITDAVGRVTTCSLSNGRVVSILDPAGRTVFYTYNGGDLVASTDPIGVTSTYTYDGNAYMTSVTVPSKGTTTFSYTSDSRGTWLSTVTHPDGSRRQYYLNPTVVKTDELGRTTEYANEKYDNRVWRNTSYRDPNGSVYALEYGDPNNPGKATARRDPRGAVTRMTYDSRGNLITLTNPLGAVTSYAYDEGDNLVSVTDPLGRVTINEYDAPSTGNLVRTTDPMEFSQEFTYDHRGLPLTAKDALGRVTTYAYDLWGNQSSITDPLGNTTRFEYDIRGNLVAVIDPLWSRTEFQYDGLNRKTAVINADGTQKTWNYSCCTLDSETDEKGRTTFYTYDLAGNLIAITDAAGGTTTFSYNAGGQQVAMVDANGNATTYTYDLSGRQTRITYPDGTGETYAYDAAGNRVAKRDGNGVITSYTWDLAGRLTASVAPGSSIKFTYDAADNLLTMRDNLGTTTYSYDRLDRVTQVTNPFKQRVLYGYDNVGNRAWMRTPYDLITYEYDAANRLTAVSAPWNTTRFEYDDAGRVTRMYDNARQAIYVYDTMGRVTSLLNARPNGETITSHHYIYDAKGNPTAVTEWDGSRTYYGYDALDRLISETRRGGPAPYSYRYTYDALGNRTSKTDLLAGRTINYTYDSANKMLTAGDAVYTYDRNGNTTSKTDSSGVTRYYWDARDKLVRADVPGIGEVRYVYDGVGRRLSQTTQIGLAAVLYDNVSPMPTIVADVYVGGTTRYSYTPTGFPVSVLKSGTAESYVYDGLGNAVATSRANTQTALFKPRDAWGNAESPEDVTRGYNAQWGYVQDTRIGLFLLGLRWYDPSSGRFLSRDPTGYVGGRNLYLYCGGQPTAMADPHGTIAFQACVAVGMVVVIVWNNVLYPIVYYCCTSKPAPPIPCPADLPTDPWSVHSSVSTYHTNMSRPTTSCR